MATETQNGKAKRASFSTMGKEVLRLVVEITAAGKVKTFDMVPRWNDDMKSFDHFAMTGADGKVLGRNGTRRIAAFTPNGDPTITVGSQYEIFAVAKNGRKVSLAKGEMILGASDGRGRKAATPVVDIDPNRPVRLVWITANAPVVNLSKFANRPGLDHAKVVLKVDAYSVNDDPAYLELTMYGEDHDPNRARNGGGKGKPPKPVEEW